MMDFGVNYEDDEVIENCILSHAHTYRQFYLLPDLMICSFGADAATAETHMIPCPQASD